MNLINKYKISFIYLAIFLMIGFYTPYWPVWLHKSRNIEPTDIGLILSASNLLKILFNLFFASISNKFGKYKKIIISLAFLTFVSFLIISIFDYSIKNDIIVIIGIIGISLFSPILPISESIAFYSIKGITKSYGILRLWGSISFICSVFLGGMLIDLYGVSIIPKLILLASCFVLLSAILSPSIKKQEQKKSIKEIIRFFSNKNFIYFILSCSLIQASHAFYYSFSVIYWNTIGFNGKEVGVLWAWAVIVEILLFFLISKIKIKKDLMFILFFCSIITALRWFLTANVTNFYILFLIQTLHSISFGLTHYLTMTYIYLNIPSGLQVSAQSIYYSLSMGLLLTVLTLCSGYIYSHLGVSVGFYIMGFVALLATCCIYYFIKINKNKKILGF